MKLFVLLGIVPLFYGVKLGWKWIVTDRAMWDELPDAYRQGFPIRALTAAALVALGLVLFWGVGEVLMQRYGN